MAAYSARDLTGLWVFDACGRPVGEVVGIVHHWNDEVSALVHSGPWRSGTGRLVCLDGAVVDDDGVHLPTDLPYHVACVGRQHTNGAAVGHR